MPFVDVDAETIFYTRHRPRGTEAAERPSLLLIHGAGGRHVNWPGKLRALPGYDVVALDLPGHSQSGPHGRDSVDAYADVVTSFIDALGLENVVVVGHSMGAAIAQMLAVRAAPGVVGLVLVGASATMPVGPAILDNIRPDFDRAIDFITRYSWSRAARAVQVGLVKRLMAETAPEVLYGDFLACHTFDVADRLPAIAMPVLVLSGAADRMTPARAGRRLAAAIPGATFKQIPRAGHFVMLEREDETAAVIRRWLTAHF